MWAIYKREVKSFFQSVIGWLFLAATIALFGLYFFVYNLSYGSPYISNTLSATTVIMLITVPVLTMRVLAEEQKAKTDQLILTAPVSVGKIVWGKYLAVGTIFTIAVVFMTAAMLFLRIFGEVPFGEGFAALLGYWLYGMTCIAVGTFISSLTESQVIAAVLSFVVLFLGYMMTAITGVISSTGNLLTKILNCFNLTEGMDQFFTGCIDIPAIVYYASLICILLFFTTQSIQKRRWSMSTRKLKMGVFSTGLIAVALVAAVAVNLVAAQLPDNISSIDVTSQKLYSITDDTRELLNNLEEDITIYVLANKDNQDTNLEKTLERYESASKHIQVVYKDPAVSPTFYKEYTDSALTSNSLIVVGSKRSKVINYNSIYQYEMDYTTYQQTLTGYDAEGQITSAISYVTSDDTGVMYAISGHNEVALSGTFTDALEKQNVDLNTITLLEYDAIPEDADCIFLLAPQTDYSADDAEKILNYLENGGKAVIVSTYTGERYPNFESILEAYGVSIVDGVVVEKDTSSYYQNPYYILPEIGYDTATSNAMSGYIFAPFAQGLSFPQQTEEEAESSDITYTQLLTTSDSSFSKVDVENAADYTQGENDIAGPLTLGLHVVKALETEEDAESTTAELYVFGCGNLFTDSASEMVYGNNLTLFTGITAQYTEGEAESVIPVKSYDMQQLVMNQTVIIMGGLFIAILIPVASLVVGIIIWAGRRKR